MKRFTIALKDTAQSSAAMKILLAAGIHFDVNEEETFIFARDWKQIRPKLLTLISDTELLSLLKERLRSLRKAADESADEASRLRWPDTSGT